MSGTGGAGGMDGAAGMDGAGGMGGAGGVGGGVGIVVVTYNSAAVLRGCLDSLVAGSEGVEVAAVVVADNASTDDTVALARDYTGLPIRVVPLGRNAGYAAGVNAGVRELERLGGVDSVLLLNPDIRLRPGALPPLLLALKPPGVGIVVPRLINPDGSLQLSLRRAPTVRGAICEAVLGGARRGWLGGFGELVTEPVRYERPGAASWATGAAMLIGSEVLRDVGPWDESFFLYSEETDFALRAAHQQWLLWYEPASVAEHLGGESSVDPALWALQAANRVRLYRRRHGRIAGTAYRAAVLGGELIRAAVGRARSRAAVRALLSRTDVHRVH